MRGKLKRKIVFTNEPSKKKLLSFIIKYTNKLQDYNILKQKYEELWGLRKLYKS